MFWRAYAGRLLGMSALIRGTILLDCFDPISEPPSKLFVVLDLGFHSLVGRTVILPGLLRPVELVILAGGAPKKDNY